MRRVILSIAVALGGCANSRPPRYEVVINVGVTEKINPGTTVTGGIEIKPKVMTGSTPKGGTTATPKETK